MRAWLLIGALLTGCDGLLVGGAGSGGGGPAAVTACQTGPVYTALSSSCAQCHGAGSNKPYFSTQVAFETLLVAKPQWVVPGRPEDSRLIALLEGRASGAFPQMPPGEPSASFAAQAAAGKTRITLDTLRCWIVGLKDVAPPAQSGPLPVARRLSAEQMFTALEAQLGVVGTAASTGNFGLSLPDAIPNTDVYGWRDQNLAALGGGHWLEQRRRNDSVNPVFTQTFVNVSQTWCRLAVNAPATSNVVLKLATLGDTSAAEPQRIRDNVRQLGRRLLALNLSDADVDAYFELFRALEPDRAAGWTAVCAAMLRDPLWLTY